MKTPAAPELEKRRAAQFAAELQERARSWIPQWGLADSERDFGRALLEIAARFNSEVAERLDGAGEKMRRGFLDWLAVRGQAARPARMPVVFKLADTAREGVLASAPVRLQADAGGTPVVFETEKDVRVVPGRLDVVVGVDADQDAFYLPPPGLSDLQPLESLPSQWRVKSFAAVGARKIQLDPELGLAVGTVLDANGAQYTIREVDNGLVTIDRPLESELSSAIRISKVTTFSPFESTAYNSQEHSLYLGDSELLNVEAAATFEVIGAPTLREGFTWQYWGKVDGKEEVGWQSLKLADTPPTTPEGGIVLTKTKGAIEELEIGGKKSRWIRVYRKTVGASDEPFANDEITMRINSAGCVAAPCPQANTDFPTAEALANTTPLVLEDVFLPLGKEPRQFDAFYLGSKEAFSKTDAKVQLCFEMADANFSVLANLHSGALLDKTVAGVAADRSLHLLAFDDSTGRLSRYGNREPLRPPSPGPSGALVANPPVPLDPRPPYRIAMWGATSGFFVAVPADGSVWVWVETTATPEQSGWQLLGAVGPVANSTAPIQALVHLSDGAAGQLFALRESKLFVRDLNDANATWEPVVTLDTGGNNVTLTQIAPINLQATILSAGSVALGLVGIGTDSALYAINFSNAPLDGTCTKLLDDVAQDVAPAAARLLDQTLVAAATGNDPIDKKVLAFQSNPSALTKQADAEAKLEWPTIVGESIDLNLHGTQLSFVFCARLNSQTVGLHAWSPFGPGSSASLFRTRIPPQVGSVTGAPTLLPQHVIVPISTSEVIVAKFDPSARLSKLETLRTAVIATAPEDLLQIGDSLALPIDGGGFTDHQLVTVAAAGIEHRGQTLYEFNQESIEDDLFVYRTNVAPLTATVDQTDLTMVTLDHTDVDTAQGTILLITTDQPNPSLYEVVSLLGRVAELDPILDVVDPNSPPATVTYQIPELSGAALRPLLHLNPTTTGNWPAELLNQTRLAFSGADPEFQTGIAFQLDALRRPELVALNQNWTTPPVPNGMGQVEFFVDASIGEWTIQLGDTSTNPDLSWEYWNGTGWWKLDSLRDATLNLKRTGIVDFKIPKDLRPTDWSGKTNHWIRARLIGGDYGKEKVKIHIEPEGLTGQVQTVERLTDGIRPPLVLKLNISYGICTGVRPTFVLAEDSGTIRDQSDANRTGGAIVEAFVPLAVMLGRLSQAVTPPAVPEDCPPDCDCHTKTTTALGAPAVETPVSTGAVPRVSGRELFIGLDATPSEAPVNVLLLVDEHNHTAFAPLKIEALVANHFLPIIADDKTRALGESGLLEMSFAQPPTPSELFGKTRTWLRLTPKDAPGDHWVPAIRGAYLNAAWASATETLTRELLGSSNGEPNLTVRVARPPLLHNTLELRVKEPLGEEEREALRQEDKNVVLSDVEGLPGDWVLWKQVIDPGDERAGERVYALDETKGEIRFGDGLHGRIPPIGRDSIVAFRYSRTEPDPTGGDRVPGNMITARTALNLVSPVETVESVTAADQAAGGAPPESDERVLRFGFARLRHRNRAVTPSDLEDLALQSSPDIVQARAFLRRGYIQLVVVMRGRNPTPNAAQMRELRNLLLAAGPVSLSAPGALRISGPRVRRLRIDLELRVETLDHAGELTTFVKAQLTNFFDTATGGIVREGWALGDKPSEEDIALALIDAPYLESIGNVTLLESNRETALSGGLTTLKPTELVVLADDPIRIQFETAEVMV